MSASSPIASHSFTFQLFAACYTALVSHSMATETTHDLPITDKPAGDEAQSDYRVESTAPVISSSPTLAATKIADRKVPEMSDFFKKTTITEEERQAYHRFSWLTGNLISMIPKVDVPTVHDSTIVCFESYLIAGLGWAFRPANYYHELPWL
jgi:ABC-type phosphate/phosphonate transport system substrate-binding protein